MRSTNPLLVLSNLVRIRRGLNRSTHHLNPESLPGGFPKLTARIRSVPFCNWSLDNDLSVLIRPLACQLRVVVGSPFRLGVVVVLGRGYKARRQQMHDIAKAVHRSRANKRTSGTAKSQALEVEKPGSAETAGMFWGAWSSDCPYTCGSTGRRWAD